MTRNGTGMSEKRGTAGDWLQSSITLESKETHRRLHKRIVEDLPCNFTHRYICDGSQYTMDNAWAGYLVRYEIKLNNGSKYTKLTRRPGYLVSKPSIFKSRKGGIFNAG